MRDHLLIFVNGNLHQVTGDATFWTLSRFLRSELNLVGTKVMCAEGDCGACTVLVGALRGNDGTLVYRAIDSCIAFMHQLDLVHVVTVEGLGSPKQLSDVQRAMVDCHGSQCGFCTPGFVVAMHGLVEEEHEQEVTYSRACPGLSDETLRMGLSGNLCRCTGYVQIIDAGKSIDLEKVTRLNEQYPPAPIQDAFRSAASSSVVVHAGERTVCVPTTLQQALRHLQETSNCRIVAGATDLGVQHNHGTDTLDRRLCLSKIDELRKLTIQADAIQVGACATWTDLLQASREVLPEFAEILDRFGSPQIRNMGSVGGNLANASPIADSIPFLLAMQASVHLASVDGIRAVDLNDFYLGYKSIDLRENELIHSIEIPLPDEADRTSLYKVSRRRDMDISTMTAAIRLRMDGSTIQQAWVALGGVGPTVIRVNEAEDALAGNLLNLKAMKEAGAIAADSVNPISDVRGSDAYRRQLSENVFIKCFYQLTDQENGVSA